jgi:epsilon-lactone hydrolase
MESTVITYSKQKHIYWILGLTILLFLGGFMVFRVFQRFDGGSSFKKNFNLNDNDHVAMLNKLNDEWEFPDEYTKEALKLNRMDMYWVYPKGTSPDKVILQLHGGAYQRSLKDNGIQYERSAVKYAELSGARVLTIDYRVAPEDPYPAALEDAVSAYHWLLDNGYEAKSIIIAGDSAGGGLTLATALYLRDHQIQLPAALITMSAWTNLNYKRLDVPYVGDHDTKDPYISPIYGDYTGFPPMLMQVGGDEKLLKDTTEVAEEAKEAGVIITQTTYDNMFHVFQLLYPVLSEANDAWTEVDQFIDTIFE